ncbi:MAG: preprotein translocase subunit YajC [Lachnospiraceae bacterium]|nr:preprotein translocase subunit YajC [Lachnospiraceae bacterium]
MISLLEATSAANPMGGGNFLWIMVIYIVVIGGAMYFISYRPQKKQQREMQALLDSLEVGDSVLTTSGFYGVVIDIKDEIVIVEFGSNKNCRIPMKKTAITEVEKAGGAEN